MQNQQEEDKEEDKKEQVREKRIKKLSALLNPTIYKLQAKYLTEQIYKNKQLFKKRLRGEQDDESVLEADFLAKRKKRYINKEPMVYQNLQQQQEQMEVNQEQQNQMEEDYFREDFPIYRQMDAVNDDENTLHQLNENLIQAINENSLLIPKIDYFQHHHVLSDRVRVNHYLETFRKHNIPTSENNYFYNVSQHILNSNGFQQEDFNIDIYTLKQLTKFYEEKDTICKMVGIYLKQSQIYQSFWRNQNQNWNGLFDLMQNTDSTLRYFSFKDSVDISIDPTLHQIIGGDQVVIEFMLNLCQLSPRLYYSQYLMDTQDTPYQRRFMGLNPLNLPKTDSQWYGSYERFAGSMNVSKANLLITYLSIIRLIKSLRQRHPAVLTVIEFIFNPISYKNISETFFQEKIKYAFFFEMMEYLIEICRNRNQEINFQYNTKYPRALFKISDKEVFMNMTKIYQHFPQLIGQPNRVALVKTSRRVAVSLDMAKGFYGNVEAEEKINASGWKGLFASFPPDRKKWKDYHFFVQILFRYQHGIPGVDMLPEEVENTIDKEYTGDQFKQMAFLTLTINFDGADVDENIIQAQEKIEEFVQAKLRGELIKLLERYQSDPDAYLSTSFIEFKTTSIWKDQQNIDQFFEGKSAELYRHKDYFSIQCFNCVLTTYCFIYCKEKKIKYDENSVLEYKFSEFYLENKQQLDQNNLFLNLELFQTVFNIKICFTYVYGNRSLFSIQEGNYQIGIRGNHCWPMYHESKVPRPPIQFILNEQEKKKKKKEKKRINIFYDIETVEIKHMKKRKNNEEVPASDLRAEILCFKINEDYLTFRGPNCLIQFVNFLLQLSLVSEETIYVFAHNGHGFDNIYLFPYLVQVFGEDVQYGGTMRHFKHLSVGSKIKFIDTLQLFPGSLANLAKDFQTEHQKMEFQKITEENISDENFMAEVEKYCINDVKVLYEIYEKFKDTLRNVLGERFDEEDIKLTLPATAVQIFKKYFCKHIIKGNPSDKGGFENQIAERNSYFGGCCQVFDYRPLDNQCEYVDFVSMYVSILASTKYPTDLGVPQMCFGFEEVDALYCVTKFKFNTSCLLPNLPVRTEYGIQYVLEHTFEESQYYWGQEIQLAYELGLEDIEITQKITYGTFQAPFKDYMQTFFQLKKQNANGPKKMIAKLFGNSLYGKFGQNQFEDKRILSRYFIDSIGFIQFKQAMNAQGHAIKNLQEIDDQYIEVTETPVCSNSYIGSLVRLASYTTSVGRCWLFSMMKSVGPENLIYCDTDSCIYRRSPNYKINRELGTDMGQIANQFKKEIVGGYCIAPKCYYIVLQNEIDQEHEFYFRCKGVKEENVNLEMMEKLRKEGHYQASTTRWERKKGGIDIVEIFKNLLLKPKRQIINNCTKPYLYIIK